MRHHHDPSPRAFRAGLMASLLLSAAAVHGQSHLPTFTEVGDSAGVRFRHRIGDLELDNIVEGTGPGGLLFDFDRDGDLDLYFVSGCWHRDVSDNRGRKLRGKLTNALYRNDGNWKFTDVTESAGVGDRSFGMGASAADYDDDGDLDLYVLNYGRNVLYENDGDGTFTDVTSQSGLGDTMWSLSAPWFDYDGDGDLDVYVANYLEYDKGKFRDVFAAENYPGPLSYSGQPDHLFRNEGDGTFTDVTEEANLYQPTHRAMSAIAFDFDSDGDSDLFVTNDAMSNTLWINDGKGHFTDQALEQGVAFGEGGQGASSMGPVVGDVDRNGLLDFLVPDMGYGCLLFQMAPGLYLDVTAQTRLTVICGQYTGWGGGLIDYDNDGWLDVFVANGNPHHLYTEEDVLARYDGKGKFHDVAGESGKYFGQKYVGRGATFGDIDNDGDIDIVVMNLDDRPRLLRNDGGNRNRWLTVIPRHRKGGAIAEGARVTVSVGELHMVHPVISVNGYLCGVDPRAHFGLGSASQADRIEIVWPGGARKVLQNVPANQFLEVLPGDAD